MNNPRWIMPVLGVCVFLSTAHSGQTYYGGISLENTTIESPVKVYGFACFKGVAFDKEVDVYGSLTASGSHFYDDVKVVGSSVEFSSNIIEGNVTIINYLKRPRLVLKNTEIHGKVIFRGLKKGIGEKDASSHLGQGVENGDVCDA